MILQASIIQKSIRPIIWPDTYRSLIVFAISLACTRYSVLMKTLKFNNTTIRECEVQCFPTLVVVVYQILAWWHMIHKLNFFHRIISLYWLKEANFYLFKCWSWFDNSRHIKSLKYDEAPQSLQNLMQKTFPARKRQITLETTKTNNASIRPPFPTKK